MSTKPSQECLQVLLPCRSQFLVPTPCPESVTGAHKWCLDFVLSVWIHCFWVDECQVLLCPDGVTRAHTCSYVFSVIAFWVGQCQVSLMGPLSPPATLCRISLRPVETPFPCGLSSGVWPLCILCSWDWVAAADRLTMATFPVLSESIPEFLLPPWNNQRVGMC